MTINFYLIFVSAILLLSTQLGVHLHLKLSNYLITMIIKFDESIMKGLNLAINAGSQIPNFFELPHYVSVKMCASFLPHVWLLEDK